MAWSTAIRKNRTTGIAAALILLAAAVRAPLMTTGLWRDEATTALDVSHGFLDTVAACMHSEFGPPGYFLTVWPIAHLAGTSEAALRAGSFIFGLVTIALTCVLGTLVRSPATGILAGAFGAFSIRSMMLGTEARPYALCALLSAAILICFVQCLREDSYRRWVAAFALCAAALEYVNYTGALFIALLAAATPPAVWMLGLNKRMPAFAIAYAAVAFAWVPWFGVLVSTASVRVPWAAPAPSLIDRAREQLGFVFPFDVLHYQATSLFVIGTFAAVLACAYAAARNAKPNFLLIVTAAIAVGIVAAALVETRLLLFAPRYMYVFTPGANVCLAAAILGLCGRLGRMSNLPARVAALAVALLLLEPAVIAQGAYYARFAQQPERSGMRAAVADLSRDHPEHTLYVVAPDYLSEVFAYYAHPAAGAAYFFANQSPTVSVSRAWIARTVEAWNAPAAVADAAAAIGRQCRRTGCETICVVNDAHSTDEGRLPYHKAVELRDVLTRNAPEGGAQWPGIDEPIQTRCVPAG